MEKEWSAQDRPELEACEMTGRTIEDSDERIVLCTCIDDLFAMPAAAMLRSAIDTLDPDRSLSVVIVDAGLRRASLRRLARSLDGADVTVVAADLDRPRELATACSSTYPPSVFLPLFVPEMGEIDSCRVIIADSDIIFQSNVGELWETPLSGAVVGAVPEAVAFGGTIGGHGYIDCDRWGIDPDGSYFNAGLTLVDVAAWRDADTTSACVDRIRASPGEMHFADQDVLNIVLVDRWKQLDPAWNQLSAKMTCDQPDAAAASGDAKAIHFNDRPKPWSSACVDPRRQAFFDSLDRTDWQRWRPNITTETVSLVRRGVRRVRSRRFESTSWSPETLTSSSAPTSRTTP